MSVPHVVESHPQKQEIIDALLSGSTLRAIAVTLDPPVSVMALCRYRKSIVRPALRRAAAVAKVQKLSDANGKTMERHGITAVSDDVAPALVQEASLALKHAEMTDPYLARIAKHQATIDAAIAEADDGKTIAALVGVDYKGIELDARLTGRLDHDKPNQSISLAVMVNIPRAIPDAPKPIPAIDVSFSSPAIDKP